MTLPLPVPLPWLTCIEHVVARWNQGPFPAHLARVAVKTTPFATGSDAYLRVDFEGSKAMAIRFRGPANHFSQVDTITVQSWGGDTWEDLQSFPLTTLQVPFVEHWCAIARTMAAPSRFFTFLGRLFKKKTEKAADQ